MTRKNLIKEIEKDNNFYLIENNNSFYRYKYKVVANKPTFFTLPKNSDQNPFIDFEEDNHTYKENKPILLSSIPLKKDIDIKGLRCVSTTLGSIDNVKNIKLFNTIAHLHEIVKNPLDFDINNQNYNSKLNLIKEKFNTMEMELGYENYYDALMLLTSLKQADIDIIKPHIDNNITDILEKTFHKSVAELTDDDISLIHIDKLYALARMENESEIQPTHVKIENAIASVEEKIDDILKHIPNFKHKQKNLKPIHKHL